MGEIAFRYFWINDMVPWIKDMVPWIKDPSNKETAPNMMQHVHF